MSCMASPRPRPHAACQGSRVKGHVTGGRRSSVAGRRLSASCLLLTAFCITLAACAPEGPHMAGSVEATQRAWFGLGYSMTAAPSPTAAARSADVVSVAIVIPDPTATPIPLPGDEGLRATLADMNAAVGTDPTGAKSQAYSTLSRFVDPQSVYGGAWWFADDGRADIYEVLAVILFTEGSTSFDVREAVAARYLWYCGGKGTHCQGAALINFLSYFQPWREPWVSRGFTHDAASKYLVLARDLVEQKPGLVSAMIPGADAYVSDPGGLSRGSSVDWNQTPFHFANVHPTWDTYLRAQLRRLPNGPARLWVLTMGEASRVCQSQFLCPDMTRSRQ
jgi:hypothetical protein